MHSVLQPQENWFEGFDRLLEDNNPSVEEERDLLGEYFFNYLVGEPYLNDKYDEDTIEIPEARVEAGRDFLLDVEKGLYDSHGWLENWNRNIAEMGESSTQTVQTVYKRILGMEDQFKAFESPEEAGHALLHDFNPEKISLGDPALKGGGTLFGGGLGTMMASAPSHPYIGLMGGVSMILGLGLFGCSGYNRMKTYERVRNLNDEIESAIGDRGIITVENGEHIGEYRNSKEPYCRI